MAVASGPNIKPVLTDSFEVGADLSTKQFYGVKLSADRTVILAAAVTDYCCGVLLNKPDNSTIKTAEVLVIGKVKIVAGETITAGDQIRIHSDGKAMIFAPDTDTTAYGCGVCTLGGASNELIEAFVNFVTQDRGEE